MNVNNLTSLSDLKLVNNPNSLNHEVSGIFACDLLSHVMGHADENNVLITVLNNMNVLGVASLLDLSCVIFSHNIDIKDVIIAKADELNIPLFRTKLSTADTVKLIAQIEDPN